MDWNNETLQYLHFGLGDVTRIETKNPLPEPGDPDFDKRLVQFMCSPEYFYFACKKLFVNSMSQPLEIAPIHTATLNTLWHYPFPMLIASRGFGKTFYLALYAILRALLNQGSKITFIGAGFRQAKTLFANVENQWHGSNILRDIVGDNGRNGPHKGTDRWEMRLNDSIITALPLGDGEKIRGERSNYLIVDEFKCIGGDSLVETNFGLIPIKNAEAYWGDLKIHIGNGIYVKPTSFVKTPPTDTYLVQLHHGLSFKCSENHPVILENGVQKLGRCLKGNDFVDTKNTFEFPENYLKEEGYTFSERFAGKLGRIFAKMIRNFDKKNYVNIDRFKLRAFNIELAKELTFQELPQAILGSPKAVVEAFLSNFLRNFLYTEDNRLVIFSPIKYLKLYQQIQIVLYKLDILSYIQINENIDTFRFKFPGDARWKIALLCNKFVDSPSLKKKILDHSQWGRVLSVTKLPEKEVLYDFCLPKPHMFYANCVKQHNSINIEVFNESVTAFASVSQNPMERVKKFAKIRYLKENKLITDEKLKELLQDDTWNQQIISGTAYYSFNHFYQYWQRYKAAILSAIKPTALDGIWPDNKLPEGLKPEHFAIMRFPVECIPEGFMDEKIIANIKGNALNSSSAIHEFNATFTTDSDGFYNRRLVESCVVGNKENPITINGDVIRFDGAIIGNPHLKYIYGVDPASESDNFAIVILEVLNDHRRVVYCWTTRKSLHSKRIKAGLTQEQNFYRFVVQKLSKLMEYFPCMAVGVDEGGGGFTIREEFKSCNPPILEMIDKDDKKDTDHLPGEHILKLINFNSTWIAQANHNMKRDLENKYLLFPSYNSVLAAATSTPESFEDNNRLYDTLEDCMWEIEDLKDELSVIQHSETPSGKERWDLPETNITGVLRKDRYSALLIANAVAEEMKQLRPSVFGENRSSYGGNVSELIHMNLKGREGPEYEGPQWFTKYGTGDFGIVVER